MDIDQYCREIEAHLCRRNGGHLVRVAGPAFDMVRGWAERGIPLKVAWQGIDRYVDRSSARGMRRRPARVRVLRGRRARRVRRVAARRGRVPGGRLRPGCRGRQADVIKELVQKYKDEITMGAGTVLDPETGRAAILAGAQFIVSPTLNLDLIELAHRYSAVVIPGAMTPTEILTAWNAGADMVKVFPAAQLGGPEYIKALRGPFPQILLVPTGGVNLQNAGSFIKAGAVVLGVGGELVDKKAMKEKKFHVITENTRAFLKVIQEARGK